MTFPTHAPKQASYDVVIVGGAIYGPAAAWFLSDDKDFDGSVLVVERDTSYTNCSTTHTNSCMRQQFSTQINVKISQFAADFVKNMRAYMGNDARVPELTIQNFGYMYLADNEAFADVLRQSQKMQAAMGAGTKILTPDEIKQAYPFYNLDDILLGSHNLIDEGYWEGITVFDWWRKSARERGVEYCLRSSHHSGRYAYLPGLKSHRNCTRKKRARGGKKIAQVCSRRIQTARPSLADTARSLYLHRAQAAVRELRD